MEVGTGSSLALKAQFRGDPTCFYCAVSGAPRSVCDVAPSALSQSRNRRHPQTEAARRLVRPH